MMWRTLKEVPGVKSSVRRDSDRGTSTRVQSVLPTLQQIQKWLTRVKIFATRSNLPTYLPNLSSEP